MYNGNENILIYTKNCQIPKVDRYLQFCENYCSVQVNADFLENMSSSFKLYESLDNVFKTFNLHLVVS